METVNENSVSGTNTTAFSRGMDSKESIRMNEFDEEKMYSTQQSLQHLPQYKTSLLQDMPLATPASVIRQKKDSVTTFTEPTFQEPQRHSTSLIHASSLVNNRNEIYSDTINAGISDPIHTFQVKGNTDIFGQARTWAESLADESLLLGVATSKYHSHSVPTSDESSFTAPLNDGNLELSQSALITSTTGSGSVKFVNATMELLQNQMKREEGPKKKRTRTTSEQLRILQKAFNTDPMPSAAARVALAKKLGMSPRAVQVWFQNRRAKGKLDQKRSEIITGTNHSTNPNASMCKDSNSNGAASFMKRSSTPFMHPIQPSNQNHIHPLHPMLLGPTASAALLCHNMNTSDVGSHSNIFVNLSHSATPMYVGHRSHSVGSTCLIAPDSVDITSNPTNSHGYKSIKRAQEYQPSKLSNSTTSDDCCVGNVNIDTRQSMISPCLNLTDNTCPIPNDQMYQDSTVDRREPVSFYSLDNNCFIPSQTCQKTGDIIQHQYRNTGSAILAQPVGLGLENLNEPESMTMMNTSCRPQQAYNMDNSVNMHPYLMQPQNNTYTYNNMIPKTYFSPQAVHYSSSGANTMNFFNDASCDPSHTSTTPLRSDGSRMDHNNQGMFIQMADIVPPSVGGWQQLPADANNIAAHTMYRSYSLPSQNGSMMILGPSFAHQSLLLPSQTNQAINANGASNLAWPSQVMLTRTASGLDAESQQFCYPTLVAFPDQSIESRNNNQKAGKLSQSPMKFLQPSASVDVPGTCSTRILTPVSNLTMNSNQDCDIIDVSFISSEEKKRNKRSTSTPSTSPMDIKTTRHHLHGIPDDPRITHTWDASIVQDVDDNITREQGSHSIIQYSKQYQHSQESSMVSAIHNTITPEELATQRRMSKSSFSALHPETSIDLNRYVQLDASLVLPVGVHDLMAEGLDLNASNYCQTNTYK